METTSNEAERENSLKIKEQIIGLPEIDKGKKISQQFTNLLKMINLKIQGQQISSKAIKRIT